MELPRGMKDLESEEFEKNEFVRSKFIETTKRFGFVLMDPSPIESLSVLETKSGPAIKDEIYYFKDKGDREVALRFDFTMGLTRYAVSQKSMKLPAKIASYGGVWRYDEPQKGRYRYFHQWDIEIYGKPSLESEAEIIEFTSRLLYNLGLKNITIDLNHRNLVESYINKTFESTDQSLVNDILRAVDKTQKKSDNEILKEYCAKGHSKEKLEKILEFSKIKGSVEEVEKNSITSELESWDYLKQLYNRLKNRSVDNIRINFGIVRGLDYYSGTVFEVFDSQSKLGALVGGGRYDNLTKAFGRDDIGATGVAGGVERIVLTMDEQGIKIPKTTKIVSVLYLNEEMQNIAMSIASSLRKKNISVKVDLVGKPFKKQLEDVSISKFAVIVAPREWKDKSVSVKDLEKGTQTQISEKDLENYLQNQLNS